MKINVKYKKIINKILSGAFIFYLLKGIMWLIILYIFPSLFNSIFGE